MIEDQVLVVVNNFSLSDYSHWVTNEKKLPIINQKTKNKTTNQRAAFWALQPGKSCGC